jgi:hypothetical protein
VKKMIIALILLASYATATVEDPGGGSSGTASNMWSSQSFPSLPGASSIACPSGLGWLDVNIKLSGSRSETDKEYVTQGKTLEFIVTVKNEGQSEAEVELGTSPENFSPAWLSWTSESLTIPAGSSRTCTLQVNPEIDAPSGEYDFKVDASAKCSRLGSARGSFVVQDYDYASETIVSGTGQFQISKNVRSMNSGIKSTKDVHFSGSVDALVKNEYLVDQARGRNPNFEEQDAVDNYQALQAGDSLFGTEEFRSSRVFGGVGAKFLESYNVQQVEFKNQNLNLHQTGSLGKTAEFATANNFTGYYLIDAKQTIAGQKNLKEREEYLGSFEVNRRILFRDTAEPQTICFDGDCSKKASLPTSLFTSPCMSTTCNNFVNNLNAFSSSA